MKDRSQVNRIACVIILLIALSACQRTPARQGTSTLESTMTTETLSTTPAPSNTPLKSPTTTPTVTPSATPSPTPTATLHWENQSLAQTPLPPLAGEINPQNVDQVVPIAVWGNGRANDIELSLDGQILVVGTDLGATLYDSQTYARLIMFSTPYPVESITFSASNDWIALGQNTGIVDVIDRRSLTLLVRLSPTDPVNPEDTEISIAFTPDSASLVWVAETATEIKVLRWSTDSWQVTVDFTLNQGLASYISPALDLIGVIHNQDLTLQSLSYPEENDLLDLPSSISPDFWDRMGILGGEIAASTDGNFLLISNGASITYWKLQSEHFNYLLDDYPKQIPDPCTQAPESCLNLNGGFSWDCGSNPNIAPIETIALTPDNIMVLISRNDNFTEFRRASDTLQLWKINATFTDIAYSPGGEFFFGLRPDGTIEKRSTLDGSLIDFIDQHPNQLAAIAFSPDGGALAAGFNDGWIRVYGTGDGQMLGVLTGDARSLAFSPDGSLLAAGLSDGTVRIFELEAGSQYDLTPRHQDAVNSLAFSRDSDQLISGSSDCTASLWQVNDRYRIRSLTPDARDPFRIYDVAQSFDSQWLFISGNHYGVYAFYDADQENILLPDAVSVNDLALSSSDASMAIAGMRTWFLSNPTTYPPLNPIVLSTEGTGESFALAFSPNNTLLAAITSTDLIFWSAESKMMLEVLPLEENILDGSQPIGLAFSPFGDLIAIGTENGLIHLFGIPTLGDQ